MINEDSDNIELATAITVAWLSNQNTRTNLDDVPAFLSSVHRALGKLGMPAADAVYDSAEYKPAIGARASLADPEYIVSMIDGRKYRTLKRHLSANGLTPDQYRERYGLKANYPVVAPAYSAARRAIANTIGLGRKVVEKVAELVTDEKPSPKARQRKSVVDARKAAKAHLGSGAE